MKGVIAISLREMVVKNYGSRKWEEILTVSNLNKRTRFLAGQDIEDSAILGVIGNTCKVLNITSKQFNEQFGRFWVESYVPKAYSPFLIGIHCAKDYILKMDAIHEKITKNMKNSRPPRFSYRWEDKQTLIMQYDSPRGLIDLLVGLAQGVLSYCKESGTVIKTSDTTIKIKFNDSKSFNIY